MKVKVQLFKMGKVFDEIVIATDYDDARRAALARNLEVSIICVTAVFEVLKTILNFPYLTLNSQSLGWL